jgi:serine/threonine-protein kinase RsbW
MARIQTADGRSGLRAQFAGGRASGSFLEIDAWIPSETKAISPLVDRLMRLIEGSRCVLGGEPAVELALREAVNNAGVHGNRRNDHKLVRVRCRCGSGKGASIIVRDQGQGFDPNAVPDSLAVENLEAERGRGIYLMKVAMDTVSFERGGTEVHMRMGGHATQEQTCRATTNPSPRESKRAEDHDHRNANGKSMDSTRPVSRTVGS